MNSLSALLLVLTGVAAVVDWVAVSRTGKPVEYVAKPLTMVLLIAAVTSFDEVDNDGARIAFVIALLWSMLGDVFLMLPDRERWFVFGLGAFLVGHLAYIPGLWMLGRSMAGLVVGVALVGVALVGVGRRIISGVGEREPRLVAPVIAYISVISAMVASAVATGRPIAIAGAVLFYSSDALIAWTSFVEEKRWGKLAIIITYHAGQVGLALALL